jgi:hypothetical protein
VKFVNNNLSRMGHDFLCLFFGEQGRRREKIGAKI